MSTHRLRGTTVLVRVIELTEGTTVLVRDIELTEGDHCSCQSHRAD